MLGDLHFPFHHKEALEWAIQGIKKFKPTHVVQIGDLYDQSMFSRFPKKKIENPLVELNKARMLAKTMWEEIQEIRNPQCIQLLGNHDIRGAKRMQEKFPEGGEIFNRTMFEYYRFDNVHTIEDDQEVYGIGDISFHHGFLSRLGDHMKKFGRNMVVGHSHVSGQVNAMVGGKQCFEFNVGYLADPESEALRYRPTKIIEWTLGYGLIEDGQPRFVRYGA